MIHRPFFFGIFLTMLFVSLPVSCGRANNEKREEAAENKAEAGVQIQDEHNSRNSLDWNGTYQGTIPCADRGGIKTSLTLMNTGEFRRTISYLGKEGGGKSDSGTFQWDDSGSKITIIPGEGEPQSYLVGENILFHLDRDGNRITGDMAEKYQLAKNKADSQLENKKWTLTELMGREFTPGKGNTEAFLYFDMETGRMSGNNGCNMIHGSYELKEGNRISFGQIASTLMACPNMEPADQFNEVLGRADNYTIADGILSLHKARMAPMARFRQE